MLTDPHYNVKFLEGGGEMGKLIRTKDWSKTAVGNPGNWPQSLRTTLSILLNSKFPMFLFWGPELVCFYNDAYRPSLGNNGKHPGMLGARGQEYWGEIWHIIKPLIDRVLSGGESSWNKDQLIPIYRNGKIEDVYWTFSHSPVRDESGNAAGVFVTCSETTEMVKHIEQRKTEHQQLNDILKISEERYHLMIEEVEEYAILYLNLEGTVENWNKGAEKIKGYKAEEIIGKNFSVFYTDTDRNNNLPQQLLDLAKQTGRAVQEGWRVRKDTTLFWASVVITAVHDHENKVVGFSKVTHDLTEKKESDDKLHIYAAELKQKNTHLENMNKELQSFAYISSHDLQEPLRKIQTFATQIVDKEYHNLSDSGKDKFQRIQSAARRMQTLIEDLLAYSRTNTTERVFEMVSLHKIIKQVEDDLKEELHAKNVTMEVSETCNVYVISFQFRQLLNNLISNSIKFSSKTETPHIKIKSNIDLGRSLGNPQLINEIKYYHISISDNGIGFDQKYSEKIFEVFQRLHSNSEYNGTGIGLAIVKKIVDNHDGIIVAKGELNKGATFDIYIPVIKP